MRLTSQPNIMGIFFFWIIGCIVAAAIGQHKTIGAAGSFFLSLLLSPLVGIIVALFSKDKTVLALRNKIILSSTDPTPTHSKADELKKFKDLLDQNAITQEEYDIMKKQLLGS